MNTTLFEKFVEIVEKSPERVAIFFREGEVIRPYSYKQLYQASLKVAGWLVRAGLNKGDRVALLLENRPEWCMVFFGVLGAGGVVVPLDIQSRPEQLQYPLEQTQARFLFTSEQASPQDLQNLGTLERIVVVGITEPSGEKTVWFQKILPTEGADCPRPELFPGDLASIIYTSGTTGPPKGVMLTHKNFLANFAGIAALRLITPEDNFLSILPLFHAFPFMATLIAPLFSAARITYIDTLKAEPILRCIKEQQVTVLAVTPQVLQHFYNGIKNKLTSLPLGIGALIDPVLDLSGRISEKFGINPARPLLNKIGSALGLQFRFFVCGGAKLSEDLARNCSRLGLGVIEGYGLTETSPVVSFNPAEAPKLGAAGKPLPGVEVRIGDLNDQGLGEILIRGDNVMEGYYLREGATREVLKDGWLHSGDLGFLDEEGYLFIQGRMKDIIVLSSGKNVSAEEVSEHYLAAPAIKEIFVTTDAKEEKLVAVIFPDFDYFRQSGETDIYWRVKWYLEFFSQRLEPYKRVKDFVLTNQELPKTRLGKVKRHEATAIYQARAGKKYEARQSAREAGVSGLGEKVLDILEKKTEGDRICLDDHLELDLGLDSLALVELVAALEQRFQLVIREGALAKVFTVGELIAFIEGQHPREQGQEETIPEQSWSEILRAAPSPALLERIGLDIKIPVRLFTRASSILLDAIFKLSFDLRVYGSENLKGHNQIICPNHASFLDGFLIYDAIPFPLKYQFFILATAVYFDLPLIRDLIKLIRIIPVDSARRLVEAMQASAYVLRQGKMLCVFPEGARTVTGELREIKKGVAILAQELGSKIVPTYISGSYEAWKPNALWPSRHPIRIIFDREHSLADLADLGLRLNPEVKDYEAVILGLKAAILNLKQKLEGR
jgi:long-chain acyl-CoA synthetase